ncbi:MAG TPA: nuclear transport factor 2 family protein [Alphaproteobacteria bacterium]|nr:nuclear transport factor 2 family protein [Alphaproteobacteria bacterium]
MTTVTTRPDPDADAIRRMVEGRVAAVRDKDVAALMAQCAPDILSFDVVSPLRRQGASALRQRMEDWFAAYDGPIRLEYRDLEVVTDGDLGFCHGLQRSIGTLVGGRHADMWVRLTLCLRRIEGRWLVVHQHLSDPFDPESGLAEIALEP